MAQMRSNSARSTVTSPQWMCEPARASLRRSVAGMSIAASVSRKTRTATAFKSVMEEVTEIPHSGAEGPLRNKPVFAGAKAPARSSGFLQRGGAGAGDVGILVFGAVAGSDGPDALGVHHERETAADGGLPGPASHGQPEREHQVRFAVLHRRPARTAADGGGFGLGDGNLNGGNLRAVHAREGQQVASIVHHADVHRNADFNGAALGGLQYGPRAGQRQLGMVARDPR